MVTSGQADPDDLVVVPLPQVRDILGHVDLSTTRPAIRVSPGYAQRSAVTPARCGSYKPALRITQRCSYGSPLSPLLSNVMLDDLDWELARRGHRFVRFADDGRIYVGSRRAGERVMQGITQYIEQRLKLRVNRQKSAVAPAVERPLLGFEFFRDKAGKVRVTVAPKALKRAHERIRQLTTRNWSVSMERRIKDLNRFTVGWTAYFSFADTFLPFDGLDKWLRRRLRQVRWKEWKRAPTRYRNLRALGISGRDARSWAASQKGYWRVAGSWPLQRALPNAYWHKTLGLKGFLDPYRGFREC